MTLRQSSAALGLTLVVGTSPAAQIGFPGFPAQGPARDSTRNAIGTAIVSGIVVTDETPARPLRRVRVSLMATDVRAPASTVTDDAGRFVLTGVAAGHYVVIASRPGYVDTMLGAPPGGIMGAPVAVTDGETVTGLTIRLSRGAVITGAVRLPNGRPVRGASLQITPVRMIDGQRRARFTTGLNVVTTDDRGVYRHFGLPPGDYLVQLLASFGPGGPNENLRQTTPDEVAWAERLGSTRTTPSPAGSAPPSGRVMMPAAIYYPGTPDLAAARVITLAAGEERAGIDMVQQHVPTGRVSGRVFDIDGSPRAGVTVRLNGRPGSTIADMIGSMLGQGARTEADGTFAIDAVAPGEYTVTSQAAPAGETQKPPAPEAPNLMAMAASMFGRGGGAGSLYASESIVVTGGDVSNLELRLREGATVSGTVVVEGATPPPAPASMQFVLAGLSASASPIAFATSMMQSLSAPVSADRTFTLRGVMPGEYRPTMNLPGFMFGTMMPTAKWTIKSIRVSGGPDLADLPFVVAANRDVTDVVVTITDALTVLSGKVVDGQGRPTSAFPIVVFSTNETHWVAGSRRVQQVRPSSDGSYRIAGLPAGEYYVGAVTALELDDLYEPSFLGQIVPIAFKITLADGETRQQDLRLGGG